MTSFFRKILKSSLGRNFLSLTALQTAGYLLPLLTLPYLARVLGVERFGLVAFANALMFIFMVVTDCGFNLSATRAIAVNQKDPREVQRIFGTVVFVQVSLALICMVLLTVLALVVPRIRAEWPLFFLAFGMVLGDAMFPTWFFQGMERMTYTTIVNIGSKLVFTLLIFVFIRGPEDYHRVPLANSAGFILAGMIALWLACRNFGMRFCIPAFSDIRTLLKETLPFFASRVSVTIYTSANALVMGLLAGNHQVGIYSAAEKLYQALQFAYYPLNTALYPYMSATKNTQLFKKLFRYITAGNTLLCLIAIPCTSWILRLLFGQEFNASSLPLQILFAAAAISIPASLLGYPFLGALGHTNQANKSVIWASAFHMVCLGILALSGNVTPVSMTGIILLNQMVVLGFRTFQVHRLRLWNGAPAAT